MTDFAELLKPFSVVAHRNAEISHDGYTRALAMLARGQRRQRAAGQALMSVNAGLNSTPRHIIYDEQKWAYQNIEDARILLAFYRGER